MQSRARYSLVMLLKTYMYTCWYINHRTVGECMGISTQTGCSESLTHDITHYAIPFLGLLTYSSSTIIHFGRYCDRVEYHICPSHLHA